VARTVIDSALVREESRGAHYRSEYPEQDDENWLRFIVISKKPNGETKVELRPVEFSRKRPGSDDPPAEELERVNLEEGREDRGK
jgi:hypothetical protein